MALPTSNSVGGYSKVLARQVACSRLPAPRAGHTDPTARSKRIDWRSGKGAHILAPALQSVEDGDAFEIRHVLIRSRHVAPSRFCARAEGDAARLEREARSGDLSRRRRLATR